MKRALMIATLLAFGLAALDAYAHNPKSGKRHHGRAWKAELRDRMAELNLSENQRERIAEVRESHQRERIQSQADLKLARLELRKLMRAEDPDQDAIDDQIDRMSSIRAEMMKSRVGQRLEVREILTPEQLNQLRDGRGAGKDEAPPREEDPRRR